ncbi:hypothetical protein DNTS_029666 [Danionella cerebrum]|uniref:Secreted protein n=1 Tax=Danionella cerebrum TaxID=2873325 RepID=A0A553QFL9_9TELE|nr:hypothetical protein DNTS_029666 [Danionella translucida]
MGSTPNPPLMTFLIFIFSRLPRRSLCGSQWRWRCFFWPEVPLQAEIVDGIQSICVTPVFYWLLSDLLHGCFTPALSHWMLASPTRIRALALSSDTRIHVLERRSREGQMGSTHTPEKRHTAFHAALILSRRERRKQRQGRSSGCQREELSITQASRG